MAPRGRVEVKLKFSSFGVTVVVGLYGFG